MNGTGRHILSLQADGRGQRDFIWGIVSRFAEPSQRCDLFFPHATFVVSTEFASSRHAHGVLSRPFLGAHRQRPDFRAGFCRTVVGVRRHHDVFQGSLVLPCPPRGRGCSQIVCSSPWPHDGQRRRTGADDAQAINQPKASHDSASVRSTIVGNDNPAKAFGWTTGDDAPSAIDNATGADLFRSVAGLGSVLGGVGRRRQAGGAGTARPSAARPPVDRHAWPLSAPWPRESACRDLGPRTTMAPLAPRTHTP